MLINPTSFFGAYVHDHMTTTMWQIHKRGATILNMKSHRNLGGNKEAFSPKSSGEIMVTQLLS